MNRSFKTEAELLNERLIILAVVKAGLSAKEREAINRRISDFNKDVVHSGMDPKLMMTLIT